MADRIGVGVGLALAVSCAAAAAQVTTASLLREMVDLDRLATAAGPAYRTEQLSSTDRRSSVPEAGGWFTNSDGFGGERTPGFAAVLRPPGEDGVGEYLVCDVAGPGAVVRGWSAGMAGTMRVFVDGAEQPLFAGTGYDFLARRSVAWLQRAAPGIEAGDAFVQQDADYFPLPFARRLRVTWEGRLRDLHFYHLQLRRYAPGTAVVSFDPAALPDLADDVAAVVRAMRAPVVADTEVWNAAAVPDDAALEHEIAAPDGGGAITALRVRLTGPDPWRAWRGVLLRIAFDGSSTPQVEAPLGDFFASGPGVNHHRGLPLAVDRDGTMTCRFAMPFASRARIELRDLAGARATVDLAVRVEARPFTAESLYFRAKWRVDHELTAAGGAAPIDLPWLVVIGRGRVVGAACMLLNPSPIPTPGGSWWGEGDEKVFLDDRAQPAVLGTGTEDYFNYSWSRPDLFDHPYCGQPLTTGPGNSGYVSNHRFCVLDDLPFAQWCWFGMELWTHRPLPGVSYARIVYHYARPGALDDHRALQAAELTVPPPPRFTPSADGGARRATFHYFTDGVRCEGAAAVTELAYSSRGQLLRWTAAAGQHLRLPVTVARDGLYAFHAVAVRQAGGGRFRAALAGAPLAAGEVDLGDDHPPYLFSHALGERELTAGSYELELTCTGAGVFDLEYAWVRLLRTPVVRLPGAIEAEAARVVAHAAGVSWQQQTFDEPAMSGGAHLWVQAHAVSDFVELEFDNPRPGARRVAVHLTGSWDYGEVALALDGTAVGEPVDTCRRQVTALPPIDLGVHQLGERVRLRVEVTRRPPQAGDPGTYLGIDCLVVE